MWWIFNDFVLFDLVLDPEDLWIFWKSIVFYGHSIPLISLMDSFELNTAMKSVLAWIKSTIKPGSGRVWAEAFVLPLSKEFRHPVIPATGWSWWFHQKRLDRSWASTKRCPRYPQRIVHLKRRISSVKLLILDEELSEAEQRASTNQNRLTENRQTSLKESQQTADVGCLAGRLL